MCCVHNLQTRQQDWFDADCLAGRKSLLQDNEHPTAEPQAVTQQQLLPWVTRQDTQEGISSVLTHLTPSNPPQ